jgi:hypothetical protein
VNGEERIGKVLGTIAGIGIYALVLWAIAEHFVAA